MDSLNISKNILIVCKNLFDKETHHVDQQRIKNNRDIFKCQIQTSRYAHFIKSDLINTCLNKVIFRIYSVTRVVVGWRTLDEGNQFL